jgi:hypothetical protein
LKICVADFSQITHGSKCSDAEFQQNDTSLQNTFHCVKK